MSKKKLIEEAKKSIQDVFNDRAVSLEQAIQNQRELIQHCYDNIDALESDIQNIEDGEFDD